MFQFRWLLFLHYIISPVPASPVGKVVLRIRPTRKTVRLQHREQETRTGREDGAVEKSRAELMWHLPSHELRFRSVGSLILLGTCFPGI